jgi:type II secretion system protein I
MVNARGRRTKGERGFTLVEVLVSLVILTIGLAALVSMAGSSTKATAYTRHAGEASVVGQDKLEQLRVMSPALLANGTDTVDAHAFVTTTGMYTRTWTVTWSGTLATVIVQVTWTDDGNQHTITYRTMRSTS